MTAVDDWWLSGAIDRAHENLFDLSAFPVCLVVFFAVVDLFSSCNAAAYVVDASGVLL